MRIVAGKFGGRKIHVPKGRDIRPTTDKVRGAIFNALESRGVVDGAQVLDCFCGTGALGLEALSRGAQACTFIDKARTSLDQARWNADALDLKGETHFMLKDTTRLGSRPSSMSLADLIFIDPPYDKDLVLPTLNVLHNRNWMKEGAILVIEMEKGAEMKIGQIYKVLDDKVYKDTEIMTLLYTKTPE